MTIKWRPNGRGEDQVVILPEHPGQQVQMLPNREGSGQLTTCCGGEILAIRNTP